MLRVPPRRRPPTEVKVKGCGKPVFQLAGAVYYNVAQTFVPPSQYSPSYAPQ